jgi:hypothetical protein
VLLTKYYLGDQIEKNNMGEACSMSGGRTDVYRILVGKPKVKGSIERPRRKWEDNIKMKFEDVG